MCRKVVYPEMNQEVRMEVIDGELYFASMDVAHCMRLHPSRFSRNNTIFDFEKKQFKDGESGCRLKGINRSTIHKFAESSNKDQTTFISWFDQMYEENKPKEPEVAMPMPVENTEHNFDKEKMKAFFEGAAEFFNMCSKMIA